MTVEEIVNSITGRGETGNPKAMTGMYLYEHKDDNSFRTLNEVVTEQALVQIYPTGDFVTIDLSFSTDTNVDMYNMAKTMKQRLELNAEKGDKHTIVLSILPVDFSNNKAPVCECMNPVMHCITALVPQGSVSTLRIVFKNEDVNFYESPDIDTLETDIAIDYDIRSREQTNMMVTQKRNEEYERRQFYENYSKNKE